MTEIRTGDFASFFDAPFAIHGDRSPYVSQMKGDLKRLLTPRESTPFPDPSSIRILTAHRDGRVVGRVCAHVHEESNRAHDLRRGYFGFFECVDDVGTASALLTEAERLHAQAGLNEIAGNFDLTAMQRIGVQTGGFDRQGYTDLATNPPYVPGLLEACGYEAFFPMTTFENVLAETPTDDLLGPRQKEILASGEYEFAPITFRTIRDRMEDARVILNDSFARNPMFVPVTRQEFQDQADGMRWIMDPRISAVLHRQGRPVACIIVIPDLDPLLRVTRSRFGLSFPWHFLRHRMKRDRAVLIFSGVVSDLQGKGINRVVLHRVLTAAKAAGYATMGGTWISDENRPSLAQKAAMKARPLHRLHLYRKALEA